MGRDGSAVAFFGQSSKHVPNAFVDGCAHIPNNPLTAATFAALFKGGPKAATQINGWAPDQRGILKYRHIGRRGGEIAIYFDVTDETARSFRPPMQKQIELVETLSPLTVDVFLAVLAQLCEKSMGSRSFYPMSAPVLVSSNTILKYKNINRWGWERSDLKRRIKHELDLLGRLRFDIVQFPCWDPSIKRWNQQGVTVASDKILDIVDADQITMLLDEREKLIDATWSIRVGHWGRWWLNAQAKVWLGRIPQTIIELDHRSNRGAATFAKKIGLGTTVLLEALKSRNFIERRIDHLLEAIGELPIMEARDTHWAGRTRDRLEEAMLRLQETRVFSNVTWPDGRGPGDPDRNKGWVERWLATKLRIYRSNARIQVEDEQAADGDAKLGFAKRRKPMPDEAEITGDAIRSIRVAESMTQSQLARQLSISEAYLSKIENDKTPITGGVKKRLMAFLGGGR